jgi:SAM-dependent methyltransferase
LCISRGHHIDHAGGQAFATGSSTDTEVDFIPVRSSSPYALPIQPRPGDDEEDAGYVPAHDLRLIFGEDPELYDRARPGYPAELFIDLAELADIGPRSRVAEIGPGTGQATAALIARGAHVVGVELASPLAVVLKRKLGRDSVEVVVSAFGDWQLPVEPFDTLACFTSWHWLDAAIRTSKAATALRKGGALVTITTFHVLGGSVEFFTHAQNCYEQWDPSTLSGVRLQAADTIPAAVDEVDDSEVFLPAVRRRYQQEIVYSTRAYLQVLGTYSGHRALSAAQRHGLLGCIGKLIDGKYGGTITKRYLYELRVAQRR